MPEKGFWVQFDFGDPASEHAHFLLRGLGDSCSHSLNAGHVRHGRHREDTGKRRQPSASIAIALLEL